MTDLLLFDNIDQTLDTENKTISVVVFEVPNIKISHM